MTKSTYAALILPWDEPASQFHPEHPRRRYTAGTVHMPKKDLKLTDGHDGPVIGLVTEFAATQAGIEATIKLGLRGVELLEQGHVGLSPEIDEDTGDLIGVAVATEGEPAFRSARILVEVGASAGFMAVTAPARAIASAPATIGRSATDLGAHHRELKTYSMQVVDDEVARARQVWEERQLELLDVDRVEEEARLVAAGVPTSQWPAHTHGRQQWEALRDAHAAQAVADEGARAAAAFKERMGRLEAQAVAVAADGEVAALDFKERMEQLEARQSRRGWRRRGR